MAEYVNIELKLPEETRTIPYTNATKDINLCDGIWLGNALYRIQGSGHRTQADGTLVRILEASAPERFNETSKAERMAHPKFTVYDLDEMLSR